MYTIGWENADLIIGESMKIDYTDVLAWLSQLAWKARRKADMAVEMIVTPYSMNDWHIKFKAVCDMIKFKYNDDKPVTIRGFMIDSMPTGENEGYIYLHPIYINNSLIFSDRTFTRPARLYIENELIRLVEIQK